MKKLLIGGAALLASAAAIAQVAPAPVAASQTKAAKVHTRAEVQAKVAEHFAKLDTNRDGSVTKAEADAARAGDALAASPSAPNAARIGASMHSSGSIATATARSAAASGMPRSAARSSAWHHAIATATAAAIGRAVPRRRHGQLSAATCSRWPTPTRTVA